MTQHVITKADRDPPVHIITEDGKLRVCLSYAAKWVAGIVAGMIGAVLIAGFTFAWQSNQTLGVIVATLEAMKDRLDKVEDKLDRKVDK